MIVDPEELRERRAAQKATHQSGEGAHIARACARARGEELRSDVRVRRKWLALRRSEGWTIAAIAKLDRVDAASVRAGIERQLTSERQCTAKPGAESQSCSIVHAQASPGDTPTTDGDPSQ
ncbi:MAG: hypothetical protein NXI31_10840 [bacterium]|nr:hypothetical protein [bacterium]